MGSGSGGVHTDPDPDIAKNLQEKNNEKTQNFEVRVEYSQFTASI
jgi:hypothetical protein